MEALLGLIGIGLLLSMVIMPWVAYSNARRAQAQQAALLAQLEEQDRRLDQALLRIDELHRAVAASRATPAPAAPTAEQRADAVVAAEPAVSTSAPEVQIPEPRKELPALASVELERISEPVARDIEPEPVEEEFLAGSAAAAEPAAVEPQPAPVKEPEPPPPLPPREPSELEVLIASWMKAGRDWLFGGNLIAKVGLLILFIGVAFLVRLTANYVTVPIQVRLAGVAAGAIALLVWGWRIREQRRGIALPAQGAALGILMLVTFGAFKLFDLIPAGAAFAMLFVLVTFTCVLAVLQDALWLAVFGISGGFAAPILTSTGSGSHVALFSYYALLNAGVLGIALKRSWRMLNVLGFAFTFIVGAAWGVQRYVPENYATSQPFLILFWVFYIALAVLYAWRRAPELKSYVDGTLVFGVPTAGMALQYGLVKDMEFGMAFAALAVALTYAATASLLWRWRSGTLRLLVESFLALAVVFGTLAIPLAFDGRWTSAVWAVEGAGIVWVGLRQRQVLAWRFGIFVQVASWIAFVGAVTGLDPAAALASNIGLGFLLLGGAGVVMALMFRQQANPTLDAEERARQQFGSLASGFIATAALWLLLGFWVEAWLRLDGAQRATVLVATALALVFGLQQLAQRATWRLPAQLGAIVAVLAGVVFICLMLFDMQWYNVASYAQQSFANLLRDGPLLGGALLSGGALVSALAFRRDAAASSAAAVRLWFLLGVFWWCGFALHGLAHALAYLTRDGWYQIPFWAGYGVGLALSALGWMLFALRRELLEPRWALRVFWPALSWAGGLAFGVQSLDGLGWSGAEYLQGNPVSAMLYGPFIGAAILCAIAAYAARRWQEGTLPYDASERDRSTGATAWLIALGVVWYGLLLDGPAQFAVVLIKVILPQDSSWALSYPQALLMLSAISGMVFIRAAERVGWSELRWLAVPAMAIQGIVSVALLRSLYLDGLLPRLETGIALAACWWAIAWCVRTWPRNDWPLSRFALQWLHFGRVVAPWLMLMPVAALLLGRWLAGPQQTTDTNNYWLLAGQWPDYIASWLGILTLFLFLRQARVGGWPLRPLQEWYERTVIPIAMAWGILLVIYWNLRQDGSMAPLPYLPLLNPLDLTTGFVALLVARVWQLNAREISQEWHLAAMRACVVLAFGWFNLMLLRTAAQYLPLPYRFDALYESQFVQVMLSIVWTLSAFVVMRFGARRASMPVWSVGAALLAVVVIKLALVDLSKVGDLFRVASFVGVGGLMVFIGYVAPPPRDAKVVEPNPERV